MIIRDNWSISERWIQKVIRRTIHCERAFMLLVALSLFGALTLSAQSGTMISITLPPANEVMKNGSVDVTIHLNVPAQPSTLKVEVNKHDMTHYFALGQCHRSPCDIAARLNGNFVSAGWNYIDATIEGPNASVDGTIAQFFNSRGVHLTDATTGYAPPFAVHIFASSTDGLEVDYAPEAGNVPTYYPNGSYPGCPNGNLTMLTLNRTTLAPKSIECFGPDDNAKLAAYQKTLTKSDLVFASTMDHRSLGKLNLAPVGGTDFTANDAPPAYGYSIVGYGASAAGLAVESYKTSSKEAWDGINGELVNIGSSTPLYGFRSTDAPAFAIQPAAMNGTAKITIGYVTSFPIGEGATPPHYALPRQFTNKTYSSPSCPVACEGGLFTAVFDAFTLERLWANTYATNSASSASEMARMSGDLRYHLTTDGAPRIAMIASVGDPFGRVTHWYDATISPTPELVSTLQSLNVPGSAIKQLIEGGSFSMIGIPGTLPSQGQGNHNITKWYSSSLLPGESGSLQGLLLRDHSFRYKPQDVAAFKVDTTVSSPTANDLLSFAIANQIGTAPSVAWPVMDTEGHRNAYAYASNQMNSRDFYGGHDCRLPRVECEDIRARYTSSQLSGIITGIDPRVIAYPGDSATNFTQDDLTDVVTQLAIEKAYLQNTASYASALKEINSSGTQNIGLSVQNSATSVSASLYDLGSSVKDSKLSLVPDILNTAAGVTSVIGVGYKPAVVISGVLSTATSLMSLTNAAREQPDPRVSRLADLLAETNGAASQYAVRFNTAVQSSTGIFFNDVYSDWFKLQTVGLMTVTPKSGWYYSTVGNSLTEFNTDFVAEAPTSFFEQVLPQYLTEVRVRKVAAWYYLRQPGYSQKTVDDMAVGWADLPRANLQSEYSFGYWPTPDYPKCDDYTFMVIKNSDKTWSSSLGRILMGPANFSDPNGSLGIPREFFFDASGYTIRRDADARGVDFCRK